MCTVVCEILRPRSFPKPVVTVLQGLLERYPPDRDAHAGAVQSRPWFREVPPAGGEVLGSTCDCGDTPQAPKISKTLSTMPEPLPET